MRTKKITIEPFGMPVYIGTSDDAWEACGISRDACYGAVATSKGKTWILLQEEYDEGTVGHEAHHLARMVSDHHGIITTADDHEIDAYLQEHIVRLIKKAYGFKTKA